MVFHRAARRELDDAMAWYEQRQRGLGLDLADEVERVLNRIQQDPAGGSPYKDIGYRLRFVRRFPYVIYYLELDESIWIAAVAHGKRRPGYWRRRKMP